MENSVFLFTVDRLVLIPFECCIILSDTPEPPAFRELFAKKKNKETKL